MFIVSLKTEAAGVCVAEATCAAKATCANAVCRIELSDGSLFSFRTCYLPPEIIETYITSPPIIEGSKISAEEETAFRHASACLRAEKTALRLIARAEQCISGLRRKLEKRGHKPTCVSAVIDRLCALSLLDDSRFARLWLESRLRLTRTPRRLFAALNAKGIDREDAQAALKDVLDDETEYALLSRFVKKQMRKSRNQNDDDRRALKFLLKAEGFSFAALERFAEEQDTQ